MAPRSVIASEQAPSSPLFSQAIVCNGMIYVSGNIGFDNNAGKLVQGSVGDRTRQALTNMRAVLEAGGSSLQNIVKCNIYLTDMANYAAVNSVYLEMMPEPKPARTCIGVRELPMRTDVEIECIAHL
ncbi:Protein mmf1 [Endocarpon pusillum Z07020]|uniref:Protein mmf1 n=1 Tax=Endocarpon pusillum (strain Z07020 / HMAS-L-300199) TaxID=1263415 RepID=U1HG25_ENDPU|nr:Protein mmf1 [Endocarpon pusillum Z07020]ERF69070.1 Protein mmf1 [Endocarpon pusillum Z07020]